MAYYFMSSVKSDAVREKESEDVKCWRGIALPRKGKKIVQVTCREGENQPSSHQ